MAEEQNACSEESPFLGDDSTSNISSTNQPFFRTGRITIISCFIVNTLFSIGNILIDIPLLQLQEAILCDHLNPLLIADLQLFQSLPDTRWRCKQENVQRELSVLQSWAVIFQLLPGLIIGIPMGIAAEKYGRKVILGLALLGTTCTAYFSVLVCAIPEVFPLRLIWLAPVFIFIGGGDMMIHTMIYTMMADVTTDIQRPLAFSYFDASMMFSGIIANPIAYMLMRRSQWLSIYTGIFIMIFCIILGFSMPETLKKAAATGEVSDCNNDNDNPGLRYSARIGQLRAATKRFGGFLHMLAREERSVSLLLLSLLLTTFGKDSALILIQYVTVKFQWEWREAGLMSSLQDAISFILFTIMIPLIAKTLLRCGMSVQLKDLWIIRASGICQIIGGFAIALAPTPAVLMGGVVFSGLSTGYNICVRSLMTSLLSHDIAMLYTTISVLQILGILIANPLLTASFRLGLHWGKEWVGLPFIIAGVLYSVALFIIGWVKLSKDTSLVLPEVGAESIG